MSFGALVSALFGFVAVVAGGVIAWARAAAKADVWRPSVSGGKAVTREAP
jgi:hypothetical protein